jgi:hypothetical protein
MVFDSIKKNFKAGCAPALTQLLDVLRLVARQVLRPHQLHQQAEGQQWAVLLAL